MKEELWKEVDVRPSSSGCIRLLVPIRPGGVVSLDNNRTVRLDLVQAVGGLGLELWLEPDQARSLRGALGVALESPLLEPGATPCV